MIFATIEGLIEDEAARGRNESTSVNAPQPFPAESKVNDPLLRVLSASTAAPDVLQGSWAIVVGFTQTAIDD